MGIEARYDARFGGFGGAPKFPSTMSLDFLLTSWKETGDKTTWQVVEHSLEAMSHGGIYDHVGGGFHRYATDAQWRVPHFEKMLYNQAGVGASLSACLRAERPFLLERGGHRHPELRKT